jgi:two-component system sensor histidine kinase UhpB
MAGDSVETPDGSLRRLLEQTTLLAAITDDQDGILYCNTALARLVHLEPSAVIGRRWTEVFGRWPADENFMAGLKRGELAATYEGRIVTASGHRIISWTNTLISGPADRVVVASLGEDITARRAAEEELRAVQSERLRLQEAILAAEAAERARLAEALHDDTIQVLTAALLNLDRMTPENLAAMRDETADALGHALDRARRLLFELRPPELDRGGLRAAVGTLSRRAAEEAGWQLSLDVVSTRYPQPVEELVFRTAREAIWNARCHAYARSVCVRVWESGGLLNCTITDDGIGFDREAVRERPEAGLHLGLAALAERLRLARGVIDITSAPGEGTEIRFAVPVGPESPLVREHAVPASPAFP